MRFRLPRQHFKDLVTRIGGRFSPRSIFAINGIVNYLAVGHWMRVKNITIPRRFATREELFDAVSAELGDRHVLYLEFGVAKGKCMRYWAKLLKSPHTHLHGFDSFQGLPTKWSRLPRGHFSTGGEPPQIEDARVQFYVGFFEETLPSYKPPAHECVVAIFDADLYSSTAYVLNKVGHLFVPGTYVYFDEFHDRANELRAFDEFLEETGMSFEVVGATLGLWGVFFKRVM
jgi:macrocin-O-methyltransferase TylF-like protien